MYSRRKVLKWSAGTAAALMMPGSLLAQQNQGRSLTIQLAGDALAIHIPAMAAMTDIMQQEMGYGPVTTNRLDSHSTLMQTILSGSADIGTGDAASTLRATEAGANLKIIGPMFHSTSLVFVVNGDVIDTLEDLTKPDVVVAVNAIGAFTHAMLVGPLLERGVDLNDVTVVEVGGSAARTQALLSGRAHAVPVHFEQAIDLANQGNYKVLLQPWREYEAFFASVYLASGEWLENPDNARAAVDLLKATLIAYRNTNSDFAWFEDKYRRHGTVAGAATIDEAAIHASWDVLANEANAWPNDMEVFTVENFERLVPVYQQAGALAGTVDLETVIDRTYLDQALSELA